MLSILLHVFKNDFFYCKLFHTGLKYVEDNNVEIKWVVGDVIQDVIKERHLNGYTKGWGTGMMRMAKICLIAMLTGIPGKSTLVERIASWEAIQGSTN